MTRRSLFQIVAGAMAGSLLARLPFVGPAVAVVSKEIDLFPWQKAQIAQINAHGVGTLWLDRSAGKLFISSKDWNEIASW